MWKEDLAKVSVRASQALADPSEYPNLFPDLDVALQVNALSADKDRVKEIEIKE